MESDRERIENEHTQSKERKKYRRIEQEEERERAHHIWKTAQTQAQGRAHMHPK